MWQQKAGLVFYDSYEALRVAVMISATLVNTQTHIQLLTGCIYYYIT